MQLIEQRLLVKHGQKEEFNANVCQSIFGFEFLVNFDQLAFERRSIFRACLVERLRCCTFIR
jgi:hypothetical protein